MTRICDAALLRPDRILAWGRNVICVNPGSCSEPDRAESAPAVAKDRSVDPLLVIGCVGGMGVIVGATVVANGILNSDWSVIGSGLFNRGSDSGALGGFLALAFIVVLGIVAFAVAAAIQMWKYRWAASAARAAQFERHGHIEDGHGRTGGGHVSP
jgi:hypothetical protein